MNEQGYEKLMQYSFRILSKKSYTVSEIRKKLLKKAGDLDSACEGTSIQPEETVEIVIERLKVLSYLNDEEFVRSYISQRMRLKPKGQSLMRYELKVKGIDKSLLEKVFDEVEVDEVSMAKEALEKKKGRWQKLTEKDQTRKAYQFLTSRGFKADAIYKAVDSCYNHVS